MATVGIMLSEVITGPQFSAFVKRMLTNYSVQHSPDALSIFQALQLFVAQPEITKNLLTGNALTLGQKSIFSGMQQTLNSNAFIIKGRSIANSTTITDSVVSQIGSVNTSSQSYQPKSPVPSVDPPFDAVVMELGEVVTYGDYRNVSASLGSIMRLPGFAAWMQSQPLDTRAAILVPYSLTNATPAPGVSTKSVRSLEYDCGIWCDMEVPNLRANPPTPPSPPPASTPAHSFFTTVKTVALIVTIVTRGPVQTWAGTILGIATLADQMRDWDGWTTPMGDVYNPMYWDSPYAYTPYEQNSNPNPDPIQVPDPSPSDPGQYEELPSPTGSYDGSDINTPGTGT